MTLLLDTSVWSRAFRRDGTMEGDFAAAAERAELTVWKPAIVPRWPEGFAAQTA